MKCYRGKGLHYAAFETSNIDSPAISNGDDAKSVKVEDVDARGVSIGKHWT